MMLAVVQTAISGMAHREPRSPGAARPSSWEVSHGFSEAMPALTMRGRYLMREYWSDSDLFLRLDAAQRELYVGLWMLADDDGWMPRDVPAIAASMFRYEDRAPREKRVRAGLDRLRDIGKVESHRCGCLFLPAVARYPRAGKKSSEHFDTHRRHLNGDKAIQTDLNPSPVPSRRYPSRPDVARENAKRNEGFGFPPFDAVVKVREP